MTAITKFVASVGVSVGLLGSVGFAAPSISTTGPGSYNKIVVKNYSSCKVANTNLVGINNATTQGATTGNAKVVWNTTGGSATSGPAANVNTTSVGLNVTNNTVNPCGCQCEVQGLVGAPTIDNTGRHSLNVIYQSTSNKVKVSNTNVVDVSNLTLQGAQSGNAKVVGNTTGGSATTGAASNSNSTGLVITVSNN